MCAFLSALDSRSLRELHLSAVELHSSSALIDYLTSPRSAPLRALKLNGNRLGAAGVGALLGAVEQGNWWLEDLEVYANEEDPGAQMAAVPVMPQAGALILRPKDPHTQFRAVLQRNRIMREETRRGAVGLLKVARVALGRPRIASSTALVLRQSPGSPARDNPPLDSTSSSRAGSTSFAWLSLPYELRLHVLSFIPPHGILSRDQFLRVCAYAEGSTVVPDGASTSSAELCSSTSPTQAPSTGPTDPPSAVNPPDAMSTRYPQDIQTARAPHNIANARAPRDVEDWLERVGCAWFEPRGDMVQGVDAGADRDGDGGNA